MSSGLLWGTSPWRSKWVLFCNNKPQNLINMETLNLLLVAGAASQCGWNAQLNSEQPPCPRGRKTCSLFGTQTLHSNQFANWALFCCSKTGLYPYAQGMTGSKMVSSISFHVREVMRIEGAWFSFLSLSQRCNATVPSKLWSIPDLWVQICSSTSFLFIGLCCPLRHWKWWWWWWGMIREWFRPGRSELGWQ